MAFGARVKLVSPRGTRHLALADVLAGVGKNNLAPDEILAEIVLPVPQGRTYSSFVKLGRQKALAIARISMAAVVELTAETGSIEEARIALGAVGATVCLATSGGSALQGQKLNGDTLTVLQEVLAAEVSERLGSRDQHPINGKQLRELPGKCLKV